MKKYKRYMGTVVIFILLIIVLVVAVERISKKQKESNQIRSIKIGVSIYDEYDTYIATMSESITAWAKQKEIETGIAITLDIKTAYGSQIKQNDQIESFAMQGYDVVCVNLVDRTDASGVIDKAKSANMPIIFFNRELVREDLERWDKIYYVGADPAESGNIQGNIIVKECKRNFSKIDKNGDGILQYVILEGEAGHQDALIRTENSVKTVISAGFTLQKLGDEIANWNRAQATTKMAAMIDTNGNNIEVIFANNDDMALGALDALEKSTIQQYPIIVGVDGTQDALESVKTKKLTGTVYNDYKGQTKAIVDMAYALSMNEKFPDSINMIEDKYVYLPYASITYDNVQEYIRMWNQ